MDFEFGGFDTGPFGEFEAELEDFQVIKVKKMDRSFKMGEGGSIFATPSMHEGIIYFGSADNHVYAISADSGKELWRFKTNGKVFSTPAVSEKILFVGSYDKNLYALDLNGEELWRFPTGGEIASSPFVYKTFVFIGSRDGYLYAIETKTGKDVWRFKTGDWIVSSPVVWNDKVYIGSFDGNLYCLSLSGKELWRFKMGAEIWSGDLSPVVSNNVIYFASMDGYVYAVDANTGKELWKVKTGKYGNWVQPIAYKNIVLQASRDEILFAFNRSGEELWRFKLGSLPGEPSVYKNTILIGDETGSFYAISLEGKELWRFQTGGKILGSCVFWNEKIFFGSFDCYLYSLNMSGGEVWRFATSSLVKVSLPPPNEAFKVEIKKSVDTEDSLEEKYRFNDVTVSADDFKNEYSTSSEYKRKSDYDTSLVIFEEDFLFSKTFNWL